MRHGRLPLIGYYQGGLGNQLFQYCAYAQAARQFGAHLISETSWYESEKRTWHIPTLCPSTSEEIRFTHPQRLLYRTLRAASKRLGCAFSVSFPISMYVNYSSDLSSYTQLLASKRRRPYILGGLFQTKAVREFECPLNEIASWRAKTIKEIDLEIIAKTVQPDSAAVHLRLGDYRSAKNQALFGNTNPDFYRASLDTLRRSRHISNCYVFTDDPPAARQLLADMRNLIWVNEFCLPLLQEFVLLSCFKNIVISNSTFAWWAAFLASLDKTQESQVVCPKPWYARPSSTDKELLVEGWHVTARI